MFHGNFSDLNDEAAAVAAVVEGERRGGEEAGREMLTPAHVENNVVTTEISSPTAVKTSDSYSKVTPKNAGDIAIQPSVSESLNNKNTNVSLVGNENFNANATDINADDASKGRVILNVDSTRGEVSSASGETSDIDTDVNNTPDDRALNKTIESSIDNSNMAGHIKVSKNDVEKDPSNLTLRQPTKETSESNEDNHDNDDTADDNENSAELDTVAEIYDQVKPVKILNDYVVADDSNNAAVSTDDSSNHNKTSANPGKNVKEGIF